MLPRRLRRLRGFDYRGRHAYTVVLTAFQRRPHFNDPATVGLASAKILQAAKAEGFAIAAYCFMQDHVHLVVRGTRDDASLPSFIKRAKQTSAFHFRRVTGGALWRTGYFERTLRDEVEVTTAIRYVLDNPVTAGLTAALGARPFSGTDLTL